MKCYTKRQNMRYAFVFVSILMIWVAILLMATLHQMNATVLGIIAVVMTLVLFVIGFRKGKS